MLKETGMDGLADKDRPNLAAFDWNDPFLLEDQLTDEERMIRDAGRGLRP